MKNVIFMMLVGLLGVVSAEKAPNIVLIFTDDQGYQDLGCFGSPTIKTPNIDQMAKEGMRLTSFYAQTVCGPSRASLMTGCYPLRLARHANPDSVHPELHLEEITLAEVLKTQGYTTGMFGKWDLAGHKPGTHKVELLPPHQGFDYSFGPPASNDHYVDLFRNGEKIESKADMSQLTRRYTDEAIAFIKRNRKRPFFVYLAHTMPHVKLAVSEEFKGKSAGGLYGDTVEELDWNVGRLMQALKDEGVDQNTYVIYTSDNGPWYFGRSGGHKKSMGPNWAEHGGSAKPLRGAKTTAWEGGLRVPFIIRAPGKVPAGTECDAVVATIDMMPTLAKLAGGTAPSDRVIDGLDVSALIHGETDRLDRPYFYYQHDCLRAVRYGQWKLMLPYTEPEKGSIASSWQTYMEKNDVIRVEKPMLFDLEVDISETTDVADRHPEKVAELMKLAKQAQQDIGDHDTFSELARTFGAQRRTLSTESKGGGNY
ncbi:Arylsulfatase [Pontiella desulfatans]|uniref:Arylsulfatase n=1 Tax=Pontiella desulfatans TaxID=2750659 RepID=A0A6C2U0P2_PONDE|nr:sulfatase [Pontiella desulfatans]SPS73748.1 sulfatase S1_14 [Kiritimatiellales bacterium]VGO13161.1 Arylsulfatase [Pontiella desulfatans]